MSDETLDELIDAGVDAEIDPKVEAEIKDKARARVVDIKEPAVEEPKAKVAPKQTEKAAPRRAESPAGAAVSGQERDTVSLAACVFKNRFQKKSLSVHHVQRRLAELGYPDAYTDKDGWYGDLTMQAVRQYQAAEGIEGDGIINMATLESLFHDDRNVTVTN